jgi:RNA ligase
MRDLFGEDAEGLVLEQESLGNITLRAHEDDGDYLIANYTPKAAYEGAWNPVTRAARGLIFHAITEEVLARPFAKFFNYGQAESPAVPLSTELFYVGNKFDGSLGIIYEAPNDEGLAVATRGSFHSEQARHATERLHRHLDEETYMYDGFYDMIAQGITPLVEIIYPENRIVLDYGGLDDLIFLGGINIETGAFMPPASAPLFSEGTTLQTVLSFPPRKNAEGWVVWRDPFTAVKIKQEDYVALHKIVTNLNEKTVWEALRKGYPDFLKFVAALPDELQPWAEEVGAKLAHEYGFYALQVDEWLDRARETAWLRTDADSTEAPTRKEFALAVQDEVPAFYRGLVFASNDGKDYQDKIWKLIEPKGPGSRPSSALVTEEEA